MVKACVPGALLELDNGNIEVKVTKKFSETELKVVVTRGGTLKARRGVSASGLEIGCAAKKD